MDTERDSKRELVKAHDDYGLLFAYMKEDSLAGKRAKCLVDYIYNEETSMDVQAKYGISASTLFRWVNNFIKRGVYGIESRGWRGRVPEGYWEELEKIRYMHPYELGYNDLFWSLRTLSSVMEERTGVKVSYEWLRQFFLTDRENKRKELEERD